eukprot:CAMPEP_0181196426 /NCGR_PEP_ID=MMETSP1096-20121128/15460_1 /TAXON_ID=156174 ORGANISM="Chrysochromulina ericina, Strain CCMP281" /NCGR_SAMPLE_ID=MMETSP1096 /ASSEMBLY_ACC=CAM_ASM_000453 /LENGTH=158 /DNA_ID=CAMNT_0023286187 /DNA_START=393 /DNA_END=870 /DNA_ORIENTATION=-
MARMQGCTSLRATNRYPSAVRLLCLLSLAMHTEERYVLHLAAHAQKLAEQSHHDHAGQIDYPPLPTGGKAIEEHGAAQVYQVVGHCEVEAFFRALDDDAEEASTGKRVQEEGDYGYPTTGRGQADRSVRKKVLEADGCHRAPAQTIEYEQPKAQVNVQ